MLDLPSEILGCVVEWATFACPRTLARVRSTCRALSAATLPDADETVFRADVRRVARDCLESAPALLASTRYLRHRAPLSAPDALSAAFVEEALETYDDDGAGAAAADGLACWRRHRRASAFEHAAGLDKLFARGDRWEGLLPCRAALRAAVARALLHAAGPRDADARAHARLGGSELAQLSGDARARVEGVLRWFVRALERTERAVDVPRLARAMATPATLAAVCERLLEVVAENCHHASRALAVFLRGVVRTLDVAAAYELLLVRHREFLTPGELAVLEEEADRTFPAGVAGCAIPPNHFRGLITGGLPYIQNH